MYQRTWEQGNTKQIGEFNVPIPDQPPESEMVNYGKPIEEQKFQRTKVPTNLKSWSSRKKYEFIKQEYNKRIEGQWQLIGGYPIYIPGLFYYYMNYWYTDKGGLPEFRYYQLLMAQFWNMVVLDPNCHGMYLLKPRRVGGTEFFLCMEYEYATRVRNVHCGMQNLTGKDAIKDYTRIVKGHDQMAWFMKPINEGTDKPKQGLVFNKPSKRITAKEIDKKQHESEWSKADELGIEPIRSRITYEVTDLGRYDGDILHRYRMGEIGKMKEITMNPLEQLEIIIPCMESDIGSKIIGKAIAETTVEDRSDKSGDPQTQSSLQISQQLYHNSDPNDRDDNNRTKSGLYRLYLNSIDCAPVDEFGFGKEEETRDFVENRRKKLEGKKLSRFKKKYPIYLDDVFEPDVDESEFNVEKLKLRKEQVQRNLDPFGRTHIDGKPYNNPCVKGWLVWRNGKKHTEVEWIPDPNNDNAPFEISKHPERSNNIITQQGKKVPHSTHLYVSGCDPVDKGVEVKGYKSKAAACVKRRYDDTVDGDDVSAGEMETNKYVCVYYYRRDDPETFYDDMVKMCHYYGTKMLGEKQKGANCIHHFRRNGYGPCLASPTKGIASVSENSKEPWLNASTSVIDQYIDCLQIYIEHFCENIDHEVLLQDLSIFTKQNRTKHDPTVAMGFTELADFSYMGKKETEANPQPQRSGGLRRYKASSLK